MATESALTSVYAFEFSERTRERGSRYCQEGRVEVVEASALVALARVRGSERYRVALVWENGFLEAACTCPHCERGFACKHIWAVLEAIEPVPGALELAAVDGAELFLAAGLIEAFAEELGGRRVAPHRIWTASAPATAPTRQNRDPGDWLGAASTRATAVRSRHRELYYVLDADRGRLFSSVGIQLMQRERTRSGVPGRLKRVSIGQDEIADSGAQDVRALSALAACRTDFDSDASPLPYGSASGRLSRISIRPGLQALLLPLLAGTGRLCERRAIEEGRGSDIVPLRWDGDAPLALELALEPGARGALELTAELTGARRLAPSDLKLVLESGLALAGDSFVRLERPELWSLVDGFRESGPIRLSRARTSGVLAKLAELRLPAIRNLSDIGWSEGVVSPVAHLAIRRPDSQTPRARYYAEVQFEYTDRAFGVEDRRAGYADERARRIVRRDFDRETELFDRLPELGLVLVPGSSQARGDVQLRRKDMPGIARELLREDWKVTAHGVRIRGAATHRMHVKSGVDWFDLAGELDFGGERVPFPQLLAAHRRGETRIALSDGSEGMIPEEWLERIAPLADFARSDGVVLRFLSSQALLLEALLAAEPEVEVDALFRRTCRRLEEAGHPTPRDAPRAFRGTLREYQREGLGWIHHLSRVGLGGCLADDMGLGKTVQVLALLAARRRRGQADRPPSLVVVPRSLVHNWISEAARFAPRLRVLDYTGPGRAEMRERFGDFDLVVTTYGTVRRDIEKLAGMSFDYAVLDEAQAIKNARAQTSKAARLLRAEHRLALSGTPVENHLGELWALFDFLNPGMLGPSVKKAATLEDLSSGTLAALSRALSPFILRRTKRQVLKELPDKTEQTLICRLEGRQRRHYDELRRYYQAGLLPNASARGMGRVRIQVLEALLRLRQVACHPGLVDARHAGDGSAKLDLLHERMRLALDEGHKVLVFSQFTKLLAIVRKRLDERAVPYAYLDGRTRKRAECVRRFQEDPACGVFLVSLKAGGQGLNLTSADIVFLLDPWWNPAVEAQAIDRVHRIGQTRPVFAYRIVAEDTIEQKVIELQDKKRELADAIITGNSGVLRQLTVEELELLLS